MASNSSPVENDDKVDREEDTIVLQYSDRDSHSLSSSAISISTAETSYWNLSTILSHQIVIVKANPNKLVEQSSYFRGLLSGCFSESLKRCFVIRWNIGTLIEVLRFIHELQIEITLDNFLYLLQAALYFGVETLLLECTSWFSNIQSHPVSRQIHLEDLILIWNFSTEYGLDSISGICTTYMARNFMWAMAYESFIDVPYSLLNSCINHPYLTVTSERHLAEAILSWMYSNVEEPKHDDNSKVDWMTILKQIRVYILPLWFLLGKRRCRYFSIFAEQCSDVIYSQPLKSAVVSMDIHGISESSSRRIRLTES